MKHLIAKIKLRIKQMSCYKSHKKVGYAVPGGMCEGHYHNGEAYRQCSVCPYFAKRGDDK